MTRIATIVGLCAELGSLRAIREDCEVENLHGGLGILFSDQIA